MNFIKLFLAAIFLFLTFSAIADFKSALILANQGDASAQYTLGVMYAYGIDVPENRIEAVKWFRLAADQGDASAQYNLGFAYANGIGVTQSYTEAVKWYRLAADQGYAEATNNLILMKSMQKNSKPNVPNPSIYIKEPQTNDPLNIRD